MRPDMDQVIIERPRRGSSRRSHKKGDRRAQSRTRVDEASTWESTARGRRFGYDCKDQTDLLGPLQRYLHKQVGRSWNQVFAEVCKQVSQNSAVQSHLRDHVRREVLRDVVVCNGTVYRGFHDRGSWTRFTTEESFLLNRGQYYVHPETGVLCRTSFEPRKRNTQGPTFVRCPGKKMKQFHLVSGVWYEVTLARYRNWDDLFEMRQGSELPVWRLRDRFLQATELRRRNSVPAAIARALASRYGRKGVYAVAARQLEASELPKMGLKASR